jgi:hypothetical protein
MAAGESHLKPAAPTDSSSASAHVNFKIVIPNVLYVHIGGENARTPDTQSVSIFSNGRNVTLNSSLSTADSRDHAHGNLVLSAAGRKVIAQEAPCALKFPRAANGDSRQVICTASMP